MSRDTVAEIAEQSAANLAAAHTAKADISKANKAIHAMGGENAVVEYVAQGGTVTALCKELGIGVSTFDRWLDRGGEARRAAYTRARARAGQSLAELALTIANEAVVADVQVAKLRVDTHRWMASKLNPEAFGDKQQPLINIDLGTMALDALRHRAVVVTPVNGTDIDAID
jgi:hypothetical protein